MNKTSFSALCAKGHEVGEFFVKKDEHGNWVVYDIVGGQKPFYLIDWRLFPHGCCDCEICGSHLYYEGQGLLCLNLDCKREDDQRLRDIGIFQHLIRGHEEICKEYYKNERKMLLKRK
jgi:hypothetical protein